MSAPTGYYRVIEIREIPAAKQKILVLERREKPIRPKTEPT